MTETRDACPKCLDKLEVTCVNQCKVVKTSGNHVWYEFSCPHCSHVWQCMFYED